MQDLFSIFTSVWIIPLVMLVILVFIGILHKKGKDWKIMKILVLLLIVYVYYMLALYVILPASGAIPGTPQYDNMLLVLFWIPPALFILRSVKNI